MIEQNTMQGAVDNLSVATLRISSPRGAFKKLLPELQQAVAGEGYENPTPIQDQCIPHLLEGRDVLGCAQTGTGKTAAFVLPLLQKLSYRNSPPHSGTPRALILAPTRELAAQIGVSINTYGQYLFLKHAVVFGGVSQSRQVQVLERGVDILVATPGRLLDLMGQGYIHLDEVEFFVLDEVDRMLDMGFIHDIRKVLAKVPAKRQTMFFSATMAPKIVELADTMVRNPVRITITPEKPAVESITQQVMFVGKEDKNALLLSLLEDSRLSKAIVFTQMKHVAKKVAKKLPATGINGTAIHGNKSQAMRIRALRDFQKGKYRVLVATDVAARGLDVDDISHVINYDLPVEAETYIHRIGRTARAGASGDAISFCCAEERSYLSDIERLLGEPVPAETDHEYHCEESRNSIKLASKNFGGGGRRSRDGKSRSSSPRNKRRLSGRRG